MNPQEALAECEVNGKVKNRIWRQLVKLNAVHEEEVAEEFVGGERKPTNNEREKHYPPPRLGSWDYLLAGEAHLLRVRWQQPEPPQMGEVALPHRGPLPAAGLLRCHGIGGGGGSLLLRHRRRGGFSLLLVGGARNLSAMENGREEEEGRFWQGSEKCAARPFSPHFL